MRESGSFLHRRIQRDGQRISLAAYLASADQEALAGDVRSVHVGDDGPADVVTRTVVILGIQNRREVTGNLSGSEIDRRAIVHLGYRVADDGSRRRRISQGPGAGLRVWAGRHGAG